MCKLSFIFQDAESDRYLQVSLYFTLYLGLSWNIHLWLWLLLKGTWLIFNNSLNLVYISLSYRRLPSFHNCLLISGYMYYSSFLHRLSSELFASCIVLNRSVLMVWIIIWIIIRIRIIQCFYFKSGTFQFWLLCPFSKFIFPFKPKVSDRVDIERKEQEDVAPHYDS